MKNSLLLVFFLLAGSFAAFAQDTYTATAGAATFENPASWTCTGTCADPLPGVGDHVVLGRGQDMYLNSTVQIASLTLTQRNTFDGASFYINSGFVLTVTGDVTISDALSSFNLRNGSTFQLSGAINNNGGLVNVQGGTNFVYRGSANQTIYPIQYGGALTLQKTGGTASLISNLTVMGGLLLNSGTLDKGNYDIYVGKNVVLNASLLSTGGTIYFNGSLQNISGSTSTTLQNINIGSNVNNNHTDLRISNSITFTGSNRTLDADGSGGGVITLLSTSETGGTAYVGQMINGNKITGNITAQRFISERFVTVGGQTTEERWRYLASPLSGVTVADWQNEVAITGPFTGASTCSGCNSSVPSLYSYNEQVLGNVSEGYDIYGFPAGNSPGGTNATTFERGRGYSIWIRDFDMPGTLDMRGSITNGTFNFPVSFTPSTPEDGSSQAVWSEAHDGWNIVGNPFLSDIQWGGSGWTFNNVYGIAYMKDNYGQVTNAGGYVTHNGAVGTNGWDGKIAMNQGFWVKANGSNPSMSADQSVKIGSTAQVLFRMEEPRYVFRINMQNEKFNDEVIVHFRSDATDEIEPDKDAPKKYNDNINLSIVSEGNQELVINSLPLSSCAKSVGLSIHELNTKGLYTLNFSGFDLFDPGFQVWLNDHFLNKRIKIKKGDSYSFDINNNPGSFGAERFTIDFNNIVKGKKESCDESNARISESEIKEFVKMYPNPVKNFLNINIQKSETTYVEIVSIDGRVLNRMDLKEGSNSIDVSNLNRGLYIIKINGEFGVINERIIKE